MNYNNFKVDNFQPIHFDFLNSVVFINETQDFDFHITGISCSYDINKLKNLIIFTYFLSPDKMYQLKFPNNILVTPNTNGYGEIDVENKKIIYTPFYDDKFFSFCVYNNKPKYTIGAVRNCEQYTKEYTDYKSLFFIRNDVPQEIIDEIKLKNGSIIKTLFLPDWFMMFTRFLPLENCKFNSSRDTDGRLIKREIFVNNEFITSNKKFHIIRDHPYHSTEILGGMWSSKNFNIPNLRFLILDFCLKNMNKITMSMGHDQNFLKNYIYQLVNNEHLLTHDNYFNYTTNRTKITIPRENKEYIGEPYDENDQYDIKLRNAICD